MRPPRRQRAASNRALAPLVGLAAGAGVGVGVHLWLEAIHLSIAAFVMTAYAAGILVVARQASRWDAHVSRHLRSFPVNAVHCRLARLLTDPAFWWSGAFGVACVLGAAWYGGIRDPLTLALFTIAWLLVDVLLTYELTLLQPTTRCRRCSYQLLAHLDPGDPSQVVRCPECGASWSKRDLCLAGVERLGAHPTRARRSAHRAA